MARQRRRIREKGKLRLSSYFKKIEDGERVAVVTDLGVKSSFPKKLLIRTLSSSDTALTASLTQPNIITRLQPQFSLLYTTTRQKHLLESLNSYDPVTLQ